MLEYSGLVFFDTAGSPSLEYYFEVTGSTITPSSQVTLWYPSTEPDMYIPVILRGHFQADTAGTHTVKIVIYIDDDTNSYIRYSLLTAIIY